jgi:hypothetical protein
MDVDGDVVAHVDGRFKHSCLQNREPFISKCTSTLTG